MQDVELATLAGAVLSRESVGDLTGGYLPVVSAFKAARVGDVAARLLGTDLAELADLLLSAAGVTAYAARAPLTSAELFVVGRALSGPPETGSNEREAI